MFDVTGGVVLLLVGIFYAVWIAITVEKALSKTLAFLPWLLWQLRVVGMRDLWKWTDDCTWKSAYTIWQEAHRDKDIEPGESMSLTRAMVYLSVMEKTLFLEKRVRGQSETGRTVYDKAMVTCYRRKKLRTFSCRMSLKKLFRPPKYNPCSHAL